MEKTDEEKLIKKSKIPAQNALRMHPFYKGKVQIVPRCQITSHEDFGIWYSPGVAAPCKKIAKDKAKVYEYTSKWNYVAVVSDGSRVLGLGNIGAEASLPVMEGKALLFKYLGGVDAFPLSIGNDKCCSADQMIQFVKLIQPTFGGINLEDISKPKCFEILDTLRADPEITIPVWHDDQQGTATVTLAGLINSLKIVGKKKNEVRIVFNGIGASNFAVSRLLDKAGFDFNNSIFVDSKGILYEGRPDLNCPENYKCEVAEKSNPEGLQGELNLALEGADVIVSLSVPGPGIIKEEWIKKMADDAIVFAMANPVPEIFPWDAKEAGARIVATGRSDFPNQVNNSLGFPGIFRGTLDVQARTITDEMCIAAAHALANLVEETEGCLVEDCIIPTMDNQEIFVREAVAVGLKAIEQDLAGIVLTEKELEDKARETINTAKDQTKFLMKEGFIPKFDNYIKD
ncbi:MAG: putative NAD-dependent malic enzyme 4 [Promethearchaeota archaeon]|nr:MAG: putative NAD-dependent malic enzyme 4 [Candidatus Lokiarchaeota archaeon]